MKMDLTLANGPTHKWLSNAFSCARKNAGWRGTSSHASVFKTQKWAVKAILPQLCRRKQLMKIQIRMRFQRNGYLQCHHSLPYECVKLSCVSPSPPQGHWKGKRQEWRCGGGGREGAEHTAWQEDCQQPGPAQGKDHHPLHGQRSCVGGVRGSSSSWACPAWARTAPQIWPAEGREGARQAPYPSGHRGY